MDRLKWETVTYTIAEFKPAGGVVTQRDVLEKYKAEHPDDEVKTFSGFKYDYQSKTVSLRIAIADNTVDVNTTSKTFERVHGSVGGEIISSNEVYVKTKLLQPEYDELKAKYNALVEAVGKDAQKFSAMLVENEELKKQLEVFLDEDYIAGDDAEDSADLVEAVGKDAQKFSAMLVENDKLKEKVDELRLKCDQLRADPFSECPHCVENTTLKEENDRLILRLAEIADDDGAKEAIINDEDVADLVEAKKAIAEDGGISLDEVEDAVENQKPVTNNDTNTVLTEAVIKRACDQAEVVGPDEDDMPEGELDDGTPDCCSDGEDVE